MSVFARWSATLALALAAAGSAAAQSPNFTPQVGQPGKDVVWVPTPEALVERMLTMAQVTPRDFVVDLGSGDGRTVIAAAKKFGATAMGVEFNPEMVALSQRNAARDGVSADRARFVRGDIFETDFSKATVVTMYLLPGLNLKLRPTILNLRPGTRIVSHQFTMDEWQPDETSYLDFRPAYLWIVPAPVQGNWRMTAASGAAYDMELEQTFQRVRGSVTFGGSVRGGLRDVTLRGEVLTFTLVDQNGVAHDYAGAVEGGRMQGVYRANGMTGSWSAVRK